MLCLRGYLRLRVKPTVPIHERITFCVCVNWLPEGLPGSEFYYLNMEEIKRNQSFFNLPL